MIDGVTVSAMSRNDRARLRRRSIGYVFQDFNLLAGLSALENVCLPMELDGIGARKARVAGMEALEELGLTDRASSFPDELSGGERQRVAIARAVVGDRHLLLADEPSGALDSANAESVIRLIRAACQRGVAGVVVTHDAQLASWADRVVFLRDGRVVDQTMPPRRTGVAARAGSDVVSLALEERPRALDVAGSGGGPARRGDLPLVVATVPARVAPAGARGGADGVRGRGDDRRSGPRVQRRTSPRPDDGDRDGFDDVRRCRPRAMSRPRSMRSARSRRSTTRASRSREPSTRWISAPRTRTAPYGHPTLRLVAGRFPTGPDDIAMTDDAATTFNVHVGDPFVANGVTRHVVGLVENPLGPQRRVRARRAGPGRTRPRR